MSASLGPLAGVKVLEFGTLIAGPFASRLFAEFGAEVIKIEDPKGGDPLRSGASSIRSRAARRCGGPCRRATRSRSR